ncbi:Conjugative transfer protein, partial [Dysosmobacter welbionis]
SRPTPLRRGWAGRRLLRSRRGRPSPPRSRSGPARSPMPSSTSGYSPALRPPPPGSPRHLEWKRQLLSTVCFP